METWISRLPMVLALEEGYDRPSWWHNGRYRAESISEQEVQPLFTMKDSWDICVCEGGPQVLPSYGQLDEETGGPLEEYVFCVITAHGGDVMPQHRYDWRPGRELTEVQATRWALHHPHLSHAHTIFNGPAKEATASVNLPAANGARGHRPDRIEVDGVDISQWITGNIDLELDEWQRAWLDGLSANQIRVSFESGAFDFDGGHIRVTDGRDFISVPVASSAMEDRDFIEEVVRVTCERFERWRSERGSGREGGGADRSGSASEGAAE